jgi:hypothetical protein
LRAFGIAARAARAARQTRCDSHLAMKLLKRHPAMAAQAVGDEDSTRIHGATSSTTNTDGTHVGASSSEERSREKNSKTGTCFLGRFSAGRLSCVPTACV